VPRVTEDRFRLLVLASRDRVPERVRDGVAIDDEELLDLGAY
jgi:hypothetical protein